MVKAKQDRRKKDIKSKLMAAIAMLLVSSIMMVSSTYAWFTLSTAPEVTGISTAVGANGNLEIALLNTETAADLNKIESTTGDSVAATNDITVSNVTWGNLVDVGNGNYGLEQIVLYPAALNGADGTFNDAVPLVTPEYGVDGRVSQLAANTLTSLYDKEHATFAGTAGYGVRAIGTSSNMTAQEKAFRSARAAGDSAKSAASTISTNSIKNSGSVLADIAITHGLDDAATFTQAQMEALLAVATDMKSAVAKIDEAYFQYIYAMAIGGDTTEENYIALTSALNSYANAEALLAAISTYSSAEVPAELATALGKLNTTTQNVNSAYDDLNDLVTNGDANGDGKFEWGEFSDAIGYLVNTTGISVNGMTISEAKADIGGFANKVMQAGKVQLIIRTGGGIYADIADHCGDFDYGITISQIKYESMNLENFPAHMYAESDLSPNSNYLTVVRGGVNTVGKPSAVSADQTLTSFYGYIIDLAFRTNASASNLMLQTDAIDRIYSDSQGVEDETSGYSTMGGGSNMTLLATTSDLTEDGIKELMGAIRVVFFTRGENDTNTVLVTATLDAANAELTGEGWVADLVIVDEVTTTTYTEDADGTYYQKTDGTYVLKTEYDAAPDSSVTDTSKLYKETSTTTTEETDGTITSLEPNTATAISVLVYLDGEKITNASVAASAATSLTGKLNLQFSSSTTLVPMEYADLMGDEVTSTPVSSANP